jgi:hypothetical protein
VRRFFLWLLHCPYLYIYFIILTFLHVAITEPVGALARIHVKAVLAAFHSGYGAWVAFSSRVFVHGYFPVAVYILRARRCHDLRRWRSGCGMCSETNLFINLATDCLIVMRPQTNHFQGLEGPRGTALQPQSHYRCL